MTAEERMEAFRKEFNALRKKYRVSISAMNVRWASFETVDGDGQSDADSASLELSDAAPDEDI